MIIYVNKEDLRSYSLTRNVTWDVIEVEVDDDFQGGGKTYNLKSKAWDLDIPPHLEEEYKNRPKGGRWTVKGWAIDDDLLAQELEAEKKAEADAIQAERARLIQEMQLKLLLGRQDEAVDISQQIDELDKQLQEPEEVLDE